MNLVRVLRIATVLPTGLFSLLGCTNHSLNIRETPLPQWKAPAACAQLSDLDIRLEPGKAIAQFKPTLLVRQQVQRFAKTGYRLYVGSDASHNSAHINRTHAMYKAVANASNTEALQTGIVTKVDYRTVRSLLHFNGREFRKILSQTKIARKLCIADIRVLGHVRPLKTKCPKGMAVLIAVLPAPCLRRRPNKQSKSTKFRQRLRRWQHRENPPTTPQRPIIAFSPAIQKPQTTSYNAATPFYQARLAHLRQKLEQWFPLLAAPLSLESKWLRLYRHANQRSQGKLDREIRRVLQQRPSAVPLFSPSQWWLAQQFQVLGSYIYSLAYLYITRLSRFPYQIVQFPLFQGQPHLISSPSSVRHLLVMFSCTPWPRCRARLASHEHQLRQALFDQQISQQQVHIIYLSSHFPRLRKSLLARLRLTKRKLHSVAVLFYQ